MTITITRDELDATTLSVIRGYASHDDYLHDALRESEWDATDHAEAIGRLESRAAWEEHSHNCDYIRGFIEECRMEAIGLLLCGGGDR